MSTNPHDIIASLAAPLAASLGLELWGVEVAFGGRSLVRVFIEGEGGASIDQCAEISRLLSLALDVEDCMPGAYVLEVSSPGLERTFFTEEQLAGAVGRMVEVSLAAPLPDLPGRKNFRGELVSAQGGVFTLKTDDAVPAEAEPLAVSFAWAAVKKAKQVHFVPEKTLPGKKPAGK